MDTRAYRDTYFMAIADTVATGTDCTFSDVGAVIVRDGAVLATGHLGTPRGVGPCRDGGCPACVAGQPLSLTCVCVHAETNAILDAARNGVRLEGATCYGTHRPCLECLKALTQAGIKRAVYRTARPRDPEYLRAYEAFASAAGVMVEALQPSESVAGSP